jgi:16S rRNA G966 N2-methylase RsmD
MDDKRDFLFRNTPLNKRALLLLDNEALYSVTDQHTANKISKCILKQLPLVETITDATACIGGNTHSFSMFFKNVIGIEIDPMRFAYLCHNMNVLEVKNACIYHGNMLDVCKYLKQDLIFIDPPWGGPNYKSKKFIDLYLSNIDLASVCILVAPYTKYIALKIPVNFNISAFNEKTKNVLKLIHRNTDLRKMHLLIYQKSNV